MQTLCLIQAKGLTDEFSIYLCSLDHAPEVSDEALDQWSFT